MKIPNFIVDLAITDGDVPSFFVCLPEGKPNKIGNDDFPGIDGYEIITVHGISIITSYMNTFAYMYKNIPHDESIFKL